MSYAIIEHAGRQYRVWEGKQITLPYQKLAVGQKVDAEKVLLVSDESGEVAVGTPIVEKAQVKLRIIDQAKGDKIRVFKYRQKKNYRRVRGHRDKITIAVVEKIALGATRKSRKAEAKVEKELAGTETQSEAE